MTMTGKAGAAAALRVPCGPACYYPPLRRANTAYGPIGGGILRENSDESEQAALLPLLGRSPPDAGRISLQGEPLPRKQSAQSLLPPVRLIVSGATFINDRRSGHDCWVPPASCDALLALRYLLMETMAVPPGTSRDVLPALEG